MEEEGLSEDFRKSFGRLIILLKCQNTTESKIRYASTLLEVTKAGLFTIGKMNAYQTEQQNALELLNQISITTRTTGRPEFVQSEVVRLTTLIGMTLMPIIVKEKLALIDDAAFSKVGSEQKEETFGGFGR